MVGTRSQTAKKASENRVTDGRVKKKTPTAPTSTTEPEQQDDDGPKYYLMKSEPDSRIHKGIDMKFSIDDLAALENQTDHWDGVRNHEAKNVMLRMRKGDLAFFYHSNCKEPGIVGIVEVVREAYPDFTAWDAKDPHYDPKSSKEKPRWWMVDVKFERKFKKMVSLKMIKDESELKDMFLVKRGRISVQPVKKSEWEYIIDLTDKLAEKESDE
eukprot:Plantae.Rhodophyta-Hildenbrandia_rubra.ctg25351.p1 GENE.Plantae.Rhodophyta-Hildenbrandia_rubra.ctg25351~~Plantae.Rhodophyta-Hildenbrandia_rubra.ctg25351.p1  ORF type:complete len:213 (+),score=50.22 Plantae.Rhodophyta-Hildenbrandia_rubra.ctg25351:125-763(+)